MKRTAKSGPASQPVEDAPIAVAHFDTDALAVDERHSAWAARPVSSVASLFESQPLEPFGTAVDRIELDGLVVQFSDGTARMLQRPDSRIAGDGIDLLGVNVLFDAEIAGVAGNHAFKVAAGGLLLLDMSQPSQVTLPSGRSIQLALPRAVAQEQLGAVATLHGVTVAPERAAILVRHLLQVQHQLPFLRRAQRARLARTMIDLLALALDRPGSQTLGTKAKGQAALMATARREIEARLGSTALDAELLCTRLGISRSALYRLFQPEGGVDAYVRRRRLEMVHAALADSGNAELIGELAYRWGFSDASHLSRQFRAAYGLTPRAFRAQQAEADNS